MSKIEDPRRVEILKEAEKLANQLFDFCEENKIGMHLVMEAEKDGSFATVHQYVNECETPGMLILASVFAQDPQLAATILGYAGKIAQSESVN